MRNPLLILLAVCLGWGAYEWLLKEPPVPVAAPVATPESTVDAQLAAGSISAEALANLEAAHPRRTEAALRNKMLVISGQIVDLRVTGMQQDTAELVLATSQRRKVRMEVDLNKYDRIRGVRKNAARYEVLNSELIKTDPESRVITVLFRVGQQLQQRSRFVNVGSGELIFAAE